MIFPSFQKKKYSYKHNQPLSRSVWKKLFYPIVLGLGFFFFSCSESQEMLQLRMDVDMASEENGKLIEESKASGYKVTQELQRSLEAHAILFVNYFQDGGEVDLEMTDKLIEYLEYYKENSDYLKTDPSFQAYLPLIYGLQASLVSGDQILATESAKQSIRGFEELLEDFPDDPLLNIYYAVILGALPEVFKTENKAWEYHLKVNKMLVENGWEDSVPIGLRKKLYLKSIELAEKLEEGSHEHAEYFRGKLQNLESHEE